MSLDPKAKRLLDMLATGAAAESRAPTAEARRDGLRKLMLLAGARDPIGSAEPRALAVRDRVIGLRLYTPPGATDELLPGLVFFHGGGLVAGSLDTHDGLCRSLAAAARCRVISVDYRLAPEHRFPGAVEDACIATAMIAEDADAFGIDPRRLALCGESAGGTLAAYVCQWLHERGGPQPAAQVLLCPVLDFAEESESRRAFAKGHLLDRATMEQDLKHYLGHGADLKDPRVSPLRAVNLGGLPPAIIHTAEFDPLRDEGLAYAGRLEAAGVPVLYTCHAGMIHCFYCMDAIIPQARTAVQLVGAQLVLAFSGAPDAS